MSEYQYYEFMTVDAPLTEEQQDELGAISTRADITASRFVNEYQWGDLKAQAEDLVARYFDLGLYVTNWGARRFLVRLPRRRMTVRGLKAYRILGEAGLDLHVEKDTVVFDFWGNAEGEDDLEVDEATRALAGLAPLRRELRSGDRRPLYLGWLAGVPFGAKAEEREPPVPPGLGELTLAQRNLVEYLAIDPDLLAAAAAGSAKGPSKAARAEGVETWLGELPQKKKDAYLRKVVAGEEASVVADFDAHLARARQEAGEPEAPRRRVGELREAAGMEAE